MKKAICKKDLFMWNGERCFTKGRKYTIVISEEETANKWLLDDSKNEHCICGVWEQHFDFVDVPERTSFGQWLIQVLLFVPAMIAFCWLLATYPDEPECE